MAQTGLAIEPPFHELLLTATESSLVHKVNVSNTSDQAVTLEILATDIQQYDAAGRVILDTKPVGGESYTLAPYITIPQSRITIPAQTTATISATVTNSPDLRAGGHYAALIVKALPSLETTQQVLPGLSSFILLRKTGDERIALSLKSHSLISSAVRLRMPQQIELVLANEGNTHVIPRGRVVVKGPGNTLVMSGIVNEDSQFVFPATERTMTVPLTTTGHVWPVMWYRATLVGTTQPASASFGFDTSFIYLNPVALAVFFFLLLVGVVLFRKKRTPL